jgi:hypothetical protein
MGIRMGNALPSYDSFALVSIFKYIEVMFVDLFLEMV